MLIDFVPNSTLYPFRSKWFESSCGPIHYIDEGSGQPIVFFHGSPTWSFLYRHVISGLRDHFRCVAIDYPGFGLSARPPGFDYAIADLTGVAGELVDHLDLDGFVIVGHDWGGPIGLGAGVERADRVAGIALSNTIFWPDLPIANRLFSVVMGSRYMQKRIVEQDLLVEKFLLGPSGPKLSAAEAEHYRLVQPTPQARAGLAAMPGQIRQARPLLARLERDVSELLGSVPTVAVWGADDRVFRPKDCVPGLRKAFADLDIIEAPGTGHFVPEEAPGAIVSAIGRRFAG